MMSLVAYCGHSWIVNAAEYTSRELSAGVSGEADGRTDGRQRGDRGPSARQQRVEATAQRAGPTKS